MRLTLQQQQAIAARAQFFFDVKPGGYFDRGDSSVLIGQGLPDLNSAIAFVSRYMPQVRVVCEVGAVSQIGVPEHSLGNAWPKYLEIDIQDIYGIKDAYITYYGSVSRPTVNPRPLWPTYGTSYTIEAYPSSGTSAGTYAGTVVVMVGVAMEVAHPTFPSGGTWWSGTLTGTYFDGLVGTMPGVSYP